MSANPVIAWCSRDVIEQLRSYAAAQGEAVEMVAGVRLDRPKLKHSPPVPLPP